MEPHGPGESSPGAAGLGDTWCSGAEPGAAPSPEATSAAMGDRGSGVRSPGFRWKEGIHITDEHLQLLSSPLALEVHVFLQVAVGAGHDCGQVRIWRTGAFALLTFEPGHMASLSVSPHLRPYPRPALTQKLTGSCLPSTWAFPGPVCCFRMWSEQDGTRDLERAGCSSH